MYHLVSKLFLCKHYWNRKKDSLIFQNKEQLFNFQENALKKICSYHNIVYNNIDLIDDIPEFKSCLKFMEMTSSGTTSGHSKKYAYPRPQYDLIESHHIWRIEKSHNLLQSKPVLVFRFNDLVAFNIGEVFDYMALGKNKVHVIDYNNAIDWDKAADYINGHKYVVMSPTEIQLLYQTKRHFSCPVILTRETLIENVYDMAKEMFTSVINKMRCWDGGLSFFSCPYNRLHVYDELCFVEKTDKLISTDFFNYCHPFIKYHNGDDGILDEGLCKCGIYGKFFEEFWGRRVDALLVDNKLVSGHRISVGLQTVLRKLGVNISYKIHQKTHDEVEFHYFGVIEQDDLNKIAACLSALVKCKIIIYYDSNLLNMKSKNCLVKSELLL